MKTFFIHTGVALLLAIVLSVLVFLYIQYEISKPVESTTSPAPESADTTGRFSADE